MTQIPGSPFRILLIDDDPIIRTILTRTLKLHGYEVIVAANGQEGLNQAEKCQPALIICDWLMEGMDGLEVCHHIKANPALASVFFILLTARTTIEDRVKGLDSGADDFLTKPIDNDELNARVRAGLRLYQSNQELQRLAQDLQIQKQRLESELAEAAGYVRSILPEPMTGVVTINARFLPSQQLGGDCFDYYWLDSDHLVIYLLDVSGHGLSAALPSISVHNLLRSHSLPHASLYKPNEVLRDLNDLFQMTQRNTRYLTIWYGVYHQSARQLTFASAGHPPAVLIAAPETEPHQGQQLKLAGMPIGFFPDSEYTCGVCDISPGSTLYVFSDGIYEVKQVNATNWTLNDFFNLLVSKNSVFIDDLDGVFHQIEQVTGTSSFKDDCSLLQVKFS